MSTVNKHVFDATQANFENDVLKLSLSTPVLVDFWAEWCEPCKALGPMLEKLAAEYNGAFRLAKVDVEAEQQLAGTFGIRSIPTVVLIKDGQMLDGFAGVLPEGQLREFLSKHVQPALSIEAPAADEPKSEARELEPAADAVTRLQREITAHPDDRSLGLDLALAQLRAGDTAAAQSALDSLPVNLASDDRATRLRGQLQLAQALDGADDAGSLRQRIENDPDDYHARDLLGVRLTLGDDPAAGMDQFLYILKQQRDWQDGLAKKRLLAAFQILDDAALVGDYRRRMASLLF